MSRMNAVTRLSIEDLDVTVQAGVTRRQLDARLRPEGVFFPVDPGADATIGGMIATGASGTTTVRYGAMRENVLSLLVVTAEGELVRTRSRARKSSAGLDLTRLFIGSEGTLGLIVEATLRLQPTPEAMAASVASFETLEGAVSTVTEVAQYGIPVARIELVDEAAIELINAHFELGPAGRADAVPRVPRRAGGGLRAGGVGARDRRRARAAGLRGGGRTSPPGGGSGTRATAPTRRRRRRCPAARS